MKGKAPKLLFALGFSLLGAFAFGMSQTDAQPAYAEGEKHVTFSNTNSEVTKGNSYYGYVYIDSLVDIATLNVSVHYDPSIVQINEMYNNVNCSIYDNSNKDDAVNFSYIFASNGPDYKTNLFYFNYSISSTASLTNSFFDIIIDEAYDFSLNVASVSGSRFNFSISEKTTVKTCNIFGSSSVDSKKEEQFELTYRVIYTSIASGSFEIKYDRDLFEFVSLTQQGFLANKMVDINSSLSGSVMVTFLGTEYSTDMNIFSIKFKTIANENTSSTIKLVASDLYDLDLDYISCDGFSTTVNLTYDSEYDESIPNMSLSSSFDGTNNKVTIQVSLQSNSYLGAGDFVLSWDPSLFTYNSYTKKFAPSFFNVNDKYVSSGQLKFSIISLTDIIDATQIIEIVYDIAYPHDDTIAEFDISGNGLSDSLTNSINLHFVGCTQSVPGKHFYEEEWTIDVQPTCTSEGSKSHHCTECDSKTDVTVIPMLEHTPAPAVTENLINPTCTEPGSYDEVIYCSVCHGELSRIHHILGALGHSYGKWSTTLEPTCTIDGEEHHICKVCGHEETRVIDALGHNYGEWHEVTAPTCIEEGLEERICSRNSSHKETRPIDALGHDYEDEWTIDVQPTCTSKGSKSHHCTRCEDKSDITEIPMLEHTPASVVTENLVAPTCTEKGGYDQVVYCSVCHSELSRMHVDIAATGHTLVIDHAVNPTCMETGLTEGSHCSVCDTVIVAQEIVPALGHNYDEWSIVVESTCTIDGEEHHICKVCGHEESRVIGALGHDYEEEWTIDVEPTCTSVGSKSHHCTRCEDKSDITEIPMLEHSPLDAIRENVVGTSCSSPGSYDEVVYCGQCHIELSRTHHVVDVLDHTYDEWSTIVEPTCTIDGEEHHICKVCGHEETRVVSALGHDYEEEWTIDVQPTCTSKGSKSHHCTRCEDKADITIVPMLEHTLVIDHAVNPACTETGLTEGSHCSVCDTVIVGQKILPALGHDYEEEWTIDVQPTCTSKGSKSHHCTRCEDKSDITEIPMLEHTPAPAVSENLINPTCTEPGSYEEVIYCSVCHSELSRVKKTIPTISHVVVIDHAVNSTCTETGLTEGSHCSICNNVIVPQKVIPLIDHTYDKWSTTLEPTCTEDGEEHHICKVCGHEESRVIGALDHDFEDEWTIDVQPTCTSKGSKSHHCTRCEDKYDITEIPMLEHSTVIDHAVNSTCTETGLTEGSHCSVCDTVIVAQEIVPALGHSFGEWKQIVAPTITSTGLEERVCLRDPSHKETRIVPKIDAAPYFKASVDSINLANDSLEESFNKIKESIEYYRLVEDKESVSESYLKLQTAVSNYNNKVSKANENHNSVSKVALSIVIGAVATTNLLAVGLALFRKKVLKV